MSQSPVAFITWLQSVRVDELRKWLCDDYWHNKLDDTELLRFFKLSQKGVDMRTTPV